MPPPPGGSLTTAAVVTALGAACFIVSAEARVVAPLLPTIAVSLGVSVAAAGSAVTLYLLPYGLCQIGYGPLGDRLGKLRVIQGAMALLGVGTVACAFAPSLAVLDLFRLATGAAAAAVFPMALAFLGDTLPYAERPRAIGVLMSGAAIGQTLSMAIGGVIGQFVSWRAVFGLYGAAALAITAGLARMGLHAPSAAERRAGRGAPAGEAPETGRGAAEAGRPWWAAYRDLLGLPAARVLYFAVAFEGFFAFGPFTYVTALLQQRDGVDQLTASLVVTANGVGALVGARLLALAARRLGERGSLIAGGLVCGLPYLVLAMPIDWRLAPVALALMGAGWPVAHAVLQTLATEVHPAARGSSLALFAFSLFVGGALGTAAHGLLIAGPGYPAVMAAGGAGLCVFALASPGWLGLTRKRRVAPETA